MTDRKTRQFRTFLHWAMTVGWAALIFHLSTEAYGGPLTSWLLGETLDFLHVNVSPENFSTLHFLFRKLAHVTEYAIFSALLYASFQNGRGFEWRARTALWCVLIAASYALADEFHQLFVPGRTGSLIDCGIDTAGASLAMLAVYGNARLFRDSPGRTAPDSA